MSGTKAGGANSRDTNIIRYGKDFYKNIGKLGGAAWNKKTSPPRGFMIGDNAKIYGAKGGTISRRGKAKK